MACVTWATACPRRCFRPLSRGPCPCPLVKTFRTSRMACCWMQELSDGFSHTKNIKTIIEHMYDSSELVALREMIGADFFFRKCG